MTDRLAQAMRDAISSLTYIANTACKRDEELMADAINVRGYARSRASAAEAALAAHEAEHSQCAAPAHEPGTKVLAAAAPAGWSIEYLWDGKISIAGGGYKAFLIEPSGGVAEKILWELAKALATQPPAVVDDTKRLDWLAERLLGADWDYGEPATCVWLIETDAAISADLRGSIDAALASKPPVQHKGGE